MGVFWSKNELKDHMKKENMEPTEMVLVRTNTTGNNIRFGVFTLLEETSEGWVLASEYGSDGVGTWFSPDNVIKRWVEKNDKFDHNAIPVGSLAVYIHRSYDPRVGQANAEKFIGLVVEKKGAKYKLMRGDKIVSVPWQNVRPFNPPARRRPRWELTTTA